MAKYRGILGAHPLRFPMRNLVDDLMFSMLRRHFCLTAFIQGGCHCSHPWWRMESRQQAGVLWVAVVLKPVRPAQRAWTPWLCWRNSTFRRTAWEAWWADLWGCVTAREHNVFQFAKLSQSQPSPKSNLVICIYNYLWFNPLVPWGQWKFWPTLCLEAARDAILHFFYICTTKLRQK